MKKFDALVIGFGKGGKTLASALAADGRTVAVAERSAQMYGGTCINVGCIPSKSLVHSAGLSAAAGGGFAEQAARYAAAIAEKHRLTAMLRQKNFDKLAQDPRITVFTGTASFRSPDSVVVALADGGQETLQAEQIFINTGAQPFIPPIPGLRESRFAYVSEQLMELEELPQRLVIIGGGYIGVEYASMFRNFGSMVTMIQNEDAFLPREDAEIAQAVLDSLRARGVEVLLAADIRSVRDEAAHAVLTVQTSGGIVERHGEAVLIATGRRPQVESLNLAAAGVTLNERGAIQTDECLCTSVPHIWAMGDVAGGLQFTYISLDDFRIVRSQLLGDGGRTTANRGAVPYSVFLDPPFSRVGLREQDARASGYQVRIARLPAAAIPKAQVLRQTTGLLKAVINDETGEILGAHFFCAESHELINTIKLAMDARLPYTMLRDAIYTHPTISEAFNDLFAAVK